MITCHEDSSSISLCLSRPFFLCVAFISSWLSSGAKMAKEVLNCESSLLTIFQKTHTHSIFHEAQQWSVCISLDQTVIKDPEMRFSWIIWVSPAHYDKYFHEREAERDCLQAQRKRLCKDGDGEQSEAATSQRMLAAPGSWTSQGTSSPLGSQRARSTADVLITVQSYLLWISSLQNHKRKVCV